MFRGRSALFDRLSGVFDNALIAQRQTVAPIDWYREAHGWAERTDLYVSATEAMFIEVATKAMAGAGLRPDQIDGLVFVSTTGISTPSIDARVAPGLGLRPDIARVPMFGLGCAGGVTGLATAARLLTGRGNFIDDYSPCSNVHHAAIVRSPHAHARILGYDVSAALAMEGVAGVITGADVARLTKPFSVGVTAPVHYYCAATDKARFVGEPVALAGVGEIDAGVASTFDAPPNPNVGLYQFVTNNPVTGQRTFDAASWASYLASGASWAQASWAEASWAEASWNSASWAEASWAEASWNANLDSMMASMASFSE